MTGRCGRNGTRAGATREQIRGYPETLSHGVVQLRSGSVSAGAGL
jgi:hypothetical protein